ncbi:hypothetical protein KIN34_10155 [Cellulomonas sp. DKR-3]|uniref:LysM domain-containing protein n=1 Tax=Cellulomonas fulva TaxID=2835530 RepID=A0ABS5TZS2_9CELL|nr:hypothetical protein [Cellulomonas fulva]MBT0994650.1 hypothetical protein [Cellulomonas fulva]
MDRRRSRAQLAGGGLLLGGVAAAAGAAALGLAAVLPWRTAGAVQVDDVVVSAVAGLGAAVCAWLALSCALGTVCVAARVLGTGWRGGEAAVRRWAPHAVRRVVAGTVGAGVALGLAATGATAAPATSVERPAAVAVSTGLPAGDAPPLAWTVTAPGPDTRHEDGTHEHDTHQDGTHDDASDDREADGSDTAERVAHGADPASDRSGTGTAPRSGARDAQRTVVVRAGDSLWTIAAGELGRSATAAEVAAAWPAWYEANREVIGSDPDVIRAGQVLVAPRATR